MPVPAASDRHADPWLLRQICDELDALRTAGRDVPEAAFSLADLIEEGISPRVVAEHAVELAGRLGL
jgi:hypothetical protein